MSYQLTYKLYGIRDKLANSLLFTFSSHNDQTAHRYYKQHLISTNTAFPEDLELLCLGYIDWYDPIQLRPLTQPENITPNIKELFGIERAKEGDGA